MISIAEGSKAASDQFWIGDDLDQRRARMRDGCGERVVEFARVGYTDAVARSSRTRWTDA